jgi:hypothetical protein
MRCASARSFAPKGLTLTSGGATIRWTDTGISAQAAR